MKYEVQFIKDYANKSTGDKMVFASDVARDLVNMGVAIYSNKEKQAAEELKIVKKAPKAKAKAKAKK